MSKTWHETIIDVHLAVTDQVSHAEHMKSDRYFIWQEDGENVLLAGNFRAERAVTGSTDLYTKNEFDPWKEEFESALDAAGLPWSYNSFQYEEGTGFYHHEWYWEVI